MWVSTTSPAGPIIDEGDISGIVDLETNPDESFLRELEIEGQTIYVPNRAEVLRFAPAGDGHSCERVTVAQDGEHA